WRPSFSPTEWRRHRTWAPVRRARAWQRPHVHTASCAGRRCGGPSCRPAFEATHTLSHVRHVKAMLVYRIVKVLTALFLYTKPVNPFNGVKSEGLQLPAVR